MKKLMMFLSMLALIVTFSACNQVSQYIDETAPVLDGVSDVTIAVDGTFNVLNGVTAEDDSDGDITSQITYTITDQIGNPVSIDLSVEGIYIIKYTVSDSFGNTTSEQRTLTVNLTGQPNEVIHVLVGDTTQAKELLELFYTDVLGDVLTSNELCMKYIGDVPFPINDSTVIQCMEGITEVRSSITSVSVGVVLEIEYEGHTVYEAEVTVTNLDSETQTDFVVFAFLTKADLVESYLHFYGDPFIHDDNGNDITIEIAQYELEVFYDSFFDVYYNIDDFCLQYFGGIMMPEDCSDLVVQARGAFGNININNVDYSEVTFPDGTTGEGFIASIELEMYSQLVTFDIMFFFVTDPETNEILFLGTVSDPLGNTISPVLNYVVVQPSVARPLIETFYSELLDPTILVSDLCIDYINERPKDGPSIEECTEAVSMMRDMIISLNVDVLYNETFQMGDNEYVEGYLTEITYLTNDSSVTVQVPLVFFDLIGDTKILLLSSPLGMQLGGYELIEVIAPEAMQMLGEFYIQLSDPYLDVHAFCTNYFEGAMLPVDPLDIDECTYALEEFITHYSGYQITGADPVQIDEEMYFGEGYRSYVELSFVDGPSEIIEVIYGFVDNGSTISIVIFSSPIGQDDSPFDTITVPLDEAFNLIVQFYDGMLSNVITSEQFCIDYMNYITFEGPTYEDCFQTLESMKMDLVFLNVIGVYEGVIEMDGMDIEGYYVTVDFDIGEGIQSANIPFVFIGDINYPLVLMLGHPLGFDDGGQYMNLVEVGVIDAQLQIEMYYGGIADTNIDLYQFCLDYYMGLPFPQEPNDIQNCADGLNNMRMGLQSFQVTSVIDYYIMWEGLEGPGYEAQLELVDFSGVSHFINVIFGFLETEYGPKLIVLSNPGGNQGIDFLDVDLIFVEMNMITLLNSIIIENNPISGLCSSYLLELPTYLDQNSCEYEFEEIRIYYDDFSVISVTEIPVNNPDDNGVIYKVEVAYLDTNGYIETRIIEVGFVDTSNGPKMMLLSGIYGEEPQREYNIIPYSLLDAEVLLDLMYTSLLSSSVDVVVFCSEYINDDPYGPSLEECVDVVNELRANYITFTIDAIVDEQLPINMNETIPAFKAQITLDGNAGPVTFDVWFIVTDNNNDTIEEFIFMSHPGGLNQGGMEFILPGVDQVHMRLEYFYSDLLDPYYNEMTFCEEYILPSPTTMLDPNSCGSYALEVKQMNLFFYIESVVQEAIPTPDGDIPGYRATLTITFDGGNTNTFDIYLAVIPNDLDFFIIFFTDEFVQGEPSGSQYAQMSVIDAENWIIQYYDALVGGSVEPILFCQVYLMLESSMAPMDPLDCEAIKLSYQNSGYVYTVLSVAFIPETENTPPYFETQVERSLYGDVIVYDTMFIFLQAPNNQILLATPFAQSVGEGAAAQELNYVTVSSAQASTYIMEMYYDVFDTTLDSTIICEAYSISTPIDMNGFCEDIEYFRHLDVANDYEIQMILEFYVEGIQYWKAIVNEIHDSGSVNQFEVHFVFALNDIDMAALVPLSSLIINPMADVNPDINIANTMIMQYYADLFNVTISDNEFCDTHHIFNPFYTGTIQDCLDGRAYALSRQEIYTPSPAMIEGYDPYLIYFSPIFVNDNGNVLQYEMSFTILIVDGIDYLVLMDELIRDVPLP